MNFIIKILSISLLIFVKLHSQVLENNFEHPFSDKIITSAEFGFTHSYSDYLYASPELLSKGSFEYFFRSKSTIAVGVKFFTGVSKLTAYGKNYELTELSSNFSTNLFFIGGGFSIAKNIGLSVPYLSIGVSHLRINPKDFEGHLLPNNFNRKYDLNTAMYSAEIGVKVPVDNFWGVNLGLNYNITNTKYIDDIKLNGLNDKFISAFIGISIYHGGNNSNTFIHGVRNKKIKKENPETKITIANLDSDNDGVPDNLDKCPNTKENVKVDKFGCEIIEEVIIAEVEKSKAKILSSNVESPIEIKTSKTSEIQNTEKTDLNNVNKSKIDKPIELFYDTENEKILSGLFFTDGKSYCFQIASVKNRLQANKEAERLMIEGHNSFVIAANPFNDNRVWYRIRIGYFESLEAAKKYKTKFFK